MKYKGFQKAWWALVGAAGTWLATAGADNGFTWAEIGGLLVALSSAAGVYQVKNSRT